MLKCILEVTLIPEIVFDGQGKRVKVYHSVGSRLSIRGYGAYYADKAGCIGAKKSESGATTSRAGLPSCDYFSKT
jgi:hypothetical protein